MNLVFRAVVIAVTIVTAHTLRAEGNSVVPSHVAQSWSTFIGEWNVAGTIGSRPVTGSAQFEWAEGKSCYIGKQTWTVEGSSGPIHLTQIAGWNPNTRESIEQGFSSEGEAATVYYQVPSKEGDAIKGTIEGVSGAGTRWSGSIKIEFKDKDEFQLTTIVGGKMVHSLTYKRQPSTKQNSSTTPQS